MNRKEKNDHQKKKTDQLIRDQLNINPIDHKTDELRQKQALFYNEISKISVDSQKADQYVSDLNRNLNKLNYCRNCGEMTTPYKSKCSVCGKRYD